MALKKVALRKLEDGIPNQALREIKALQEIEDNPYVSVFNTLKGIVFILPTLMVQVPEQSLWPHILTLEQNILVQVRLTLNLLIDYDLGRICCRIFCSVTKLI